MTEIVSDFVECVFGFRKLLLMLAIFIVGVVFRIKNDINGQEFVDLMKATTLGFFTANGWEHLQLTARSYLENKAKPVATKALETIINKAEEG